MIGMRVITLSAIYCSFILANGSASAQSRGHAPIVTTTEDKQQVVFDVSTFLSWKIGTDTPPASEWPNQETRNRLIAKWTAAGLVPVQQFPLRILKDVYVLEYGYSKHDTQRIYLVDCGEALLLIDPSYAEFQPMVEDNIKALGYQSSQVKWVLNTHCHIDHAAGSSYWRKKGVRIIAHKDDANAIETGNQITASYLNAFGPKSFTPVAGRSTLK